MRIPTTFGFYLSALTLICSLLFFAPPAQATSLPPSERVTINLGETQWKYLFGDPNGASTTTFDDSSWTTVGIPYSADQLDTFVNTESGYGQLNGPISWYRNHFTLDSKYTGNKVLVEFEGSHTGVQVFINGTLLPGISAVPADATATHVVGFVPFIVDLTPYVKFGGSNVLAVRAAKNADFFEQPSFSGAPRFGQADSGLFRPVHMYITAPVHIPQNVYSNLQTWGTYVATVSASDTSALIEVQTNVLNESATAQPVTLTTQIVDAAGNVVATAQSSQTVAPNTLPGLHPQLFDQQLTVTNPTLWYPNNSIYGKPYMYKVFHIVSIQGTVIDAVQSPLGIRTITWDQNLPYFNGKPHYLWGGAGRYDYPGLGTAMPEEQKWRDLQLLAEAGGSLYRPGHSTESEEFVDAADAFGIMIVQPSGEGEGAFSAHCDAQPCDDQTLKSELHRDMIVRDRNHPSILAWEADNGAIDTEFAQSLKALSKVWDPINTRAQADRTPNPANGDILGCTLEGCEVLVKQEFPGNPAWGAEYWGTGTARQAWDSELAFAAPFLDNWRQGKQANTFGMVQWYLADSPGENSDYIEGVPHTNVRSLGASMLDMNRFPKLLYYVYEAAWTPYELKPVVHLAHHWNRQGSIQVNAFSNCPAVRLLINGVPQGADQTPNPWNSDSRSNLTQTTTLMPFQVHWNVTWAAGNATAECLDVFGNVVASDTKVTAGAEHHIELDVVPELVRPDGTSFGLAANGSDAAFVVAKVVDAQGNVVPTAADNLTFSVSGPATYVGGTEHYVTPNQPLGYHAPGDPELQVEGGMTKIALRSQFATGTVTVTATAPGLLPGSASYTVGPITDNDPVPAAPSVIIPPTATAVTAGQPAQFSVTATGAAPLSFQWQKNGTTITGATGATYQTPATSQSDNGAVYSVVVSNTQGKSVSSNAPLTVVAAAAPTIVTPPAAQVVVAGQTAQFSVVAAGSPSLTYQWRRNGTPISGAIGSSYTTPPLTANDSGAGFSVAVTNPVTTVISATAQLTINAPVAPGIVTQPQSLSVLANQPATFTVVANGSQPISYQWQKNGISIAGANGASFTIPSVQATDAANYTVVVSNIAGNLTSGQATLSLAPPGANLAINGKASASSYENQGSMPASAAFDGNLSTRWGSAIGVDPSWIQIDLGSVQTFDRVVLHWENAYATSYQILWSNNPTDDPSSWHEAYATTTGMGGVEDFTFPTVKARYVRMNGRVRATQYGYSLFEFQIYNVAQCGDANERYTILSTSTVLDNLSQLVWQRAQHTFTQAGAQFTQPIAATYCQSINARLPTLSEALSISGANDAACAFPQSWSTWTSTPFPKDNTFAYFVSSTGASNFAVADNFPGWSLCTQGTGVPGPVITTQPVAQTVALGQTATFTVAAVGADPLTYQWFKNNVAIAGATAASYTTPATAAGDNGAIFSVTVGDATGLTTPSSQVALSVVNSGSGSATLSITTQPAPQTVAVGQTATFTVVATGTGTLSYQWLKSGTAITGATAASYTTPATVAGDNGTQFRVTVMGQDGSVVTSNSVALTVTTSGGGSGGGGTGGGSGGNSADIVAIAAGTTTATGNFSADKDFVGGNGSHNGAAISTAGVAQAAPQAVYQSERAGASTYTIPGLTAGSNYTLRLHFAEFYWTKPGQRVFNVAVNGAMMLPNFDVVAAAGGPDIAVVKSFTTAADSNGQITIALTSGGADQPKISGIEVASPNGGPVITAQPAAQSAALGQAATFSVTATGAAPLTYQWYKNGTLITGATSASYTTPATVAGDSASTFFVVVSGSGDNITSSMASLQVTDSPGTSLMAIAAGSTTAIGNFTADTDFNGGGGNSRAGAPITVAGIVDAAPQAVYQTERAGTFTYTVPGLTAGASYSLRLHFAEFYWTKPGQRVFNVNINGTQVLSNFDIVAAAGGPNIALIKPFTATASSAGQIVVKFTNGSADQPKVSGIEVLIPGTVTPPPPVVTPPSIATQPVAQTVAVGQTATFSVVASGTAPLTYQWYRGSAAITGATAASYTTPATTAADNGAAFKVIVTGTGGNTATSNVVALTVTGGTGGGTGGGTAPAITLQPRNQTAIIGRTAQFSVGISGSDPSITYQWMKNGVVIQNANAATYTTPGTIATDNNALFSVTVTNGQGLAATSSKAMLTVNSKPSYSVVPGFVSTDLNNNTNGVWQDNQIYVTILGNDPTTGALSWVNFDGTVTAASVADNDAPNHLTAAGQNYPNYAFTLAQSKQLMLPPLSSGRVYISEGNPLYMKIMPGDNGVGYAGPNPLNVTDPNLNTHYDWLEFTYGDGGLFINTTQVDQFGLPLLLDVWGTNETFHMQTGINESIMTLDQEYVAETPTAFHLPLPSNLRIFSPGHSTFDKGETNAGYFDQYVSSIWSNYATNTLTVPLFGGSREFVGNTTPTQFVFSEVNLHNGAFVGGTYTVAKPTTQDIVFCNNSLANGNTVQLALEAQICAAFNRSVMQNFTSWTQPSSYYLGTPSNSYARFWHNHSVAGLAYGFSYDDVNNQSSLIQSQTPEHMSFGIGW
ncbi:MAG TPA: beta-1,3-glucanase family protein [Aliidongia sp.]|nr:beta-1,3-glucanase family protein [Aliidongia sp.]